MANKRAFTLIELLVVISIIAILIALLLPALSRAKYTTQTTQCLANFRQVGQSALSYGIDRKGILPQSTSTNANPTNPQVIQRVVMQEWLAYGMNQTSSWFCPTRGLAVHDNIAIPQISSNPQQLMDDLELFGGGFIIFPQSWLTPRTECLSVFDDDGDGDVDDQFKVWPSSIEHPNGGIRPIMADTMFARAGEPGVNIGPQYGWGGHQPGQPLNGAGTMESGSSLYVDGHASVRATSELDAFIVLNNWWNFYHEAIDD